MTISTLHICITKLTFNKIMLHPHSAAFMRVALGGAGTFMSLPPTRALLVLARNIKIAEDENNVFF